MRPALILLCLPGLGLAAEPSTCPVTSTQIAVRQTKALLGAPNFEAKYRSAGGHAEVARRLASRLRDVGARIDQFGVEGLDIVVRGRIADLSLVGKVAVPGVFAVHAVDEVATAKAVEAAGAARVAHRLPQMEGPPGLAERLPAAPPGRAWLTGPIDGGREMAVLVLPPALGPEDLEPCAARVVVTGIGHPALLLAFTARGKDRFDTLSVASIEKRVALVVDATIVSAPRVKQRIPGGRVQLSGPLDADLELLQALLRSGPLPESIEFTSIDTPKGGR